MKRVILVLLVCLLCGCTDNNAFKFGYSTNLKNSDDMSKLEEIFKDSNVSNGSLILSWIKDFNKESDMGCGIVNKWSPTSKMKYNDAACMERYEKNHDLMDGDCRINAYALLMNSLNFNKTFSDYGSYLMFDIDVIDTNDDYKVLRNRKDEFITLFNEIKVDSNIDMRSLYSNKWEDHGISINNDKASLISVLFYSSDDETIFVGHAGVLIKLDDGYLFMEKIAFEQPYQISIIKNKEDLQKIIFSRDNYLSEELGPFIYENNKLLYEYKKTS